MKINKESSFLNEKAIKKIEEQYNAKYVLESCIKNKNGGWCDFPAAIFYTPEPHPEGSNYFAIFLDPQRTSLMISNGFTATVPTYTGTLVEDEVLYSRYRHDFRSVGETFVDGGRDYFRTSSPVENWVNFKIVEDRLEVIEEVA